MSIILWGQYPRSESLVQATRDWDRKRIDETKLHEEQKKNREQLFQLQKEFRFQSTGQFHWEDLMRPFSKLSPTLAAGPLTRFFETNTFWRKLEGDGNIDPHTINSWIQDYFPETTANKTIYTFPFWHLFQHFSSGPSLDHFIPLFKKLPKGLLVFFEPCLGWKSILPEQKTKAHNFLKTLKQKTNSEIVLITSFHNLKEELNDLYKLPVDGIGIDFYHNTIEETLPNFPKDKWLISGILDTDSTSKETPEAIQTFKIQAERYCDGKNIFYSHSGPAELLPREVMDEKVSNLQENLS